MLLMSGHQRLKASAGQRLCRPPRAVVWRASIDTLLTFRRVVKHPIPAS